MNRGGYRSLPLDCHCGTAPIYSGRPSARFPWPGASGLVAGDGRDLATPQPRKGRIRAPLAEFCFCPCTMALRGSSVQCLAGVPLATRADSVAERMHRLRSQTDLITQAGRSLAGSIGRAQTTNAYWLHGDLHPLNVLVLRGRITGIIDWGDITSGDVATDLAALWMLFDGPESSHLWPSYGHIEQATLACQGWAVLFGWCWIRE